MATRFQEFGEPLSVVKSIYSWCGKEVDGHLIEIEVLLALADVLKFNAHVRGTPRSSREPVARCRPSSSSPPGQSTLQPV